MKCVINDQKMATHAMPKLVGNVAAINDVHLPRTCPAKGQGSRSQGQHNYDMCGICKQVKLLGAYINFVYVGDSVHNVY